LARPDEYDPLSFEQTDELLAFAAAQERPFVADVPDDFQLRSFASHDEIEPTLKDVALEISAGTVLASVVDSRYTLIKPRQAARSRGLRTDRYAITALIKSAREKSVPSIDDLARFAEAVPHPDDCWLSESYLRLFDPSDVDADWTALRLYGCFGPEVRSALQKGTVLPVKLLNQAQVSILGELVYGARANFEPEPLALVGEMSGDQLQDMVDQTQIELSQLEPTDLTPNGLEPGCSLNESSFRSAFALPERERGLTNLGGFGAMDPYEFANAKSGFSDNADAMPIRLPNRFRAGTADILTFKVRLSPKFSVSNSVISRRIPTESKVVAEANLPGEFLHQMNDQLDSMKARHSADVDIKTIHPR